MNPLEFLRRMAAQAAEGLIELERTLAQLSEAAKHAGDATPENEEKS